MCIKKCLFYLTAVVFLGSMMACNRQTTNATNADLRKGYYQDQEEGAQGSSSAEREETQVSTSEPNANQQESTTSPSDGGSSSNDSSSSGSSSNEDKYLVSPINSMEQIPEWYRPLFTDSSSMALIRRSEIKDPQSPDIDHSGYYTTNCQFSRVINTPGLVVSRLQCDQGEDDFLQGYYVAAREGVWLTNQAPRSIDRLNVMIERGQVYEIPLFPAHPVAGSRALRSDQGDALFALEQTENGGWCRSFSIPGQSKTYEYQFCLGRNGLLRKAAHRVRKEGVTLKTIRYERWDGGFE